MARILVVDDVDLVRMAVGKVLKRAGHAIEEATNGDDALARIAVRPPDAVVTDIWMPGSDGLGLIRAVRAKYPAIGLVAMSGGSPGCDQNASLDQARADGDVQLLLKPIDKDELLAAVNSALNSHHPQLASGI